jgi:hypothetical protein
MGLLRIKDDNLQPFFIIELVITTSLEYCFFTLLNKGIIVDSFRFITCSSYTLGVFGCHKLSSFDVNKCEALIFKFL